VTNLASSIGSLSTCFFTYLAAGEPTLAEKSYRWIINGRFLNSEAGEFQLSWLGLGRALAAEGNRAALSVGDKSPSRLSSCDRQPEIGFCQ
jgi:hypothetical protein